MELRKPGGLMIRGQIYNRVITIHALVMIFFIVIPALVGGFGNWMLPILLGAPDIRLPRLNAIRFWLLPLALLFVVSSLVLDGGAGSG